MRQRKAKPGKEIKMTVNNNAKIAREEDLERILRLAVKHSKAAARKEGNAKQRQFTKPFPQGKCVKRKLSQIKFASQHWWDDGKIFRPYKKNNKIQRKLAASHAKAALIYEALRRRKEVQDAWLQNESNQQVKDWQEFACMVIQHFPSCWQELDEMTRGRFVDLMQSPWFVPPLGYSTFPDKSRSEDCERVTLQKLPPLGEMDNSSKAQDFIQYLKRLEDAGFIFVAIDHKSSQRDAYALNALRRLLRCLPPTVRKQDLRFIIEHHLAPNISAEQRLALEEKGRQGILAPKNFDEAWLKSTAPTSNLYASWHTTATFREEITGKSKRKGNHGEIVVEEMRFDLPKLYTELANLDNGKIQQSDFVARLRLS